MIFVLTDFEAYG